jgi:hypothetical protein
VVRNLNPGYFGCFTPICSCGESRLLISWCVGDRCDMAGSDEDLGRSRRPDADVSQPVPRKKERSLHTCAQDVQITRMATI